MQIKLPSIKIKVRTRANLAHIIASSFQIKWPQTLLHLKKDFPCFMYEPHLCAGPRQPCTHLRKNKRFENNANAIHTEKISRSSEPIEGGEKEMCKDVQTPAQDRRRKSTDGGAFVRRKGTVALVMCIAHETKINGTQSVGR